MNQWFMRWIMAQWRLARIQVRRHHKQMQNLNCNAKCNNAAAFAFLFLCQFLLGVSTGAVAFGPGALRDKIYGTSLLWEMQAGCMGRMVAPFGRWWGCGIQINADSGGSKCSYAFPALEGWKCGIEYHLRQLSCTRPLKEMLTTICGEGRTAQL